MNIFVGNLSFEAKKEDVYQVFAAFGVVSSVEIVMEKKGKKSRGFGFLEMPNEQEALSAIVALNGREILGRPINVMPSLPKKPKKDISTRENEHRPVLKRTGKYREGRRTISYMKKRLDAGMTTPVAGRKYKPNPMRWRKKPRWAASSQKPEGELKPWQRPQGESKPWEKSRGGPKPWVKTESSQLKSWKKPEGELKPWQKHSGAKPWQKSEGASKPWQKRSDVKPWRKSSSARQQPNFKKYKGPVSHKK